MGLEGVGVEGGVVVVEGVLTGGGGACGRSGVRHACCSAIVFVSLFIWIELHQTGSVVKSGKVKSDTWLQVLLADHLICAGFFYFFFLNSVQKNFNHPTRGNFVVVMAGS